MDKLKIFRQLNNIIGKTNTARLYSRLKAHSLRKFYNGKSKDCDAQTVVYMIDGRIRHGGLSDRLRGLMTVYNFALSGGRKFKINWTFPFRLEDYLMPNPDGPDWRLAPGEISYSPDDADTRFVAGFLKLDKRPDIIEKVGASKKPQIHFYANNALIHTEKYKEWFNRLFVPDPRLADAVARCKAIAGNKPYVSVTLRFQALLGDFFEGSYPVLQDPGQARRLIDKCTAAVLDVQARNPGKMVLVTSDSHKFIEHISQYPGIFTVPGDVVHMDYTSGSDYGTYMKSFVDLLMLMDADRLYGYYTEPMFDSSGFFYTAALLGGKEAVFLHD